MEGDSRG